jgi:hypothetical protein
VWSIGELVGVGMVGSVCCGVTVLGA